MAILNPVHGLVVPFLCVFTIPLAIFAGITTTLAFSVLMFRVTVVYLDIALALLPHYMLGRSPSYRAPSEFSHHYSDGVASPISPASGDGHVRRSPTQAPMISDCRSPPRARSSNSLTGLAPIGNVPVPVGRRSRRSSQASVVSMGTITPVTNAEPTLNTTPIRSAMFPSVGIERDFEGVGGWRLEDRPGDADWAKINSRLELPLDRTLGRHHQRTTSGGTVTPGDGYLMVKPPGTSERAVDLRDGGERYSGMGCSKTSSMSANSSRVRINQGISVPAALTSLEEGGDYFSEVVLPNPIKKAAA